jgi:predicted TPR repeat methyltransferase
MGGDLLTESLALYDACRWEEAGAVLVALLAEQPGNVTAWYRLGNVRGEQGRDKEAIDCFARAVALDPAHAKSWNNLGTANQRLGHGDEALSAYRTALDRDPELFEPYLNLGRLYGDRGDLAAAAGYLSAGLDHHPAHPMLVHLLAAARGRNTERAPRDHIVAYFDDFADKFDHTLVNTLEYRIPAALAELLHPLLRAPARVLDLGCGTGLMGAAIAKPGLDIVGVDLSPRMLELAQARRIYSKLILAEASEALAQSGAGAFRAVLAADVFIYIGELEEIFRGVARALEPQGLFAFSVEALPEGGGYRLQPSGRYAHSLDYLRRLAAGSGLRVRETRAVEIRREAGGFAGGHLLLLERL